jgi:hypothetical protein
MTQLRDLTGQTFGRLVATKRAPNHGRRTMWECLCECGNVTTVHMDSLVARLTESCGCLRKEVTAERSITHGATIGRKDTKEYKSWTGCKDRCFNPNSEKYYRYGGRGITVCERWVNDFAAFLSDMGLCPKGLTLERVNLNGNYEPLNCIWADSHTQARNRSDNVWLEHNGRKMILFDWARELGIDPKRLHALVQYKNKTLQEVINEQQLRSSNPRCSGK